MKKTAATAIPNELFSYELKIRQLAEWQVGQKIGGYDEDTIGRWKRGIASPQISVRPKIEEFFGGKSIEKLGWPGKNRIPNWHLGDSPNPLFTGRGDILKWLHGTLDLRGNEVSLPVQALTGLGGVGKSQIVIEYAHKYKHEYHTVLRLRAGTRETLAADFADIASHIGLDLPKDVKNDLNKQIDAVKVWLNHEDITRWLLIFDGADDPTVIDQILHDYVPEPRQGHVIITTRSRPTGFIEHQKEIDSLTIDESAQSLLRRAKMTSNEEDNTLARMIAEKLGGLPLALEQAGAYVEKTGCSLARYLELYQTVSHKRLLHYKKKVPNNTEKVVDSVSPQAKENIGYLPIAATLSISFDHVKRISPLAYDLLSLLSFYAPEHIPEELVSENAQVLNPTLQRIAQDPVLLDNAMGLTFRLKATPLAEDCLNE